MFDRLFSRRDLFGVVFAALTAGLSKRKPSAATAPLPQGGLTERIMQRRTWGADHVTNCQMTFVYDAVNRLTKITEKTE